MADNTIDLTGREVTYTTLGAISTEAVIAYQDEAGSNQTLTLYATENVVAQALKDVYVLHGSNDYFKVADPKTGTYLSISGDNGVVIRDTLNQGIAFDTADLTIGKTRFLTSNDNVSIVSSDPVVDKFTFKNTLIAQSNLRVDELLSVERDATMKTNLYVYNDTEIAGNVVTFSGLFGREISLYKESSNNNAIQVGYGLHINDEDNLEIVKYNFFQGSVTPIAKRCALFGNYLMSSNDTTDVNFQPFIIASADQSASNAFLHDAQSQGFMYTTGSLLIGTSNNPTKSTLYVPGIYGAPSFLATDFAASPTFLTTSDERLKTIGGSIDGSEAMSNLMGLKPVTYSWAADSNLETIRAGFTAQNVGAMLPFASETTKTSLPGVSNDELMQIDNTALIAYLVAAVKELNARVESRDQVPEVHDVQDVQDDDGPRLNGPWKWAKHESKVRMLGNKLKSRQNAKPDSTNPIHPQNPMHFSSYVGAKEAQETKSRAGPFDLSFTIGYSNDFMTSPDGYLYTTNSLACGHSNPPSTNAKVSAYGNTHAVQVLAGDSFSAKSFLTTSDERFKDLQSSINPAEAMSNLMGLNPVTYKWTADKTEKTHAGFTAQNIGSVLPLALGSNNDVLQIDNTAILAYLTAAVKDLAEKVNVENKPQISKPVLKSAQPSQPRVEPPKPVSKSLVKGELPELGPEQNSLPKPATYATRDGETAGSPDFLSFTDPLGNETLYTLTSVVTIGSSVIDPTYTMFVHGLASTTSMTVEENIISPVYLTISDERLKNIHSEISSEEALDAVMNLTPLTYTWSSYGPAGLKAGFTAQDVGEEMPLAIRTRPMMLGDENIDALHIDNTAMIAYLVAAVQEIAHQV